MSQPATAPPASEPLLRVEGLRTTYGRIEALKGISLEVNEGEIVTLIGSNGAGKTTTLRTINGIVAPRAGKITFAGTDITPKPRARHRQARHRTEPRGPAPVPAHDRAGASSSAPTQRTDADGIAGRPRSLVQPVSRVSRSESAQKAGTLWAASSRCARSAAP